jgi:HAD superfamily hydrolase (TIGR01490 family)
MKLALFDFDGTITTKDSLECFIKFAVGSKAYYLGLLKLSPMLTAYKLKLIPNYVAKQKLISYFFKGWDQLKLELLGAKYSEEKIASILRPLAMKKIRWHQEHGHKVVLVSASMETWLRSWCQESGIELLGTQLEFENGYCTGKFVSKNCYGIEKVNRIKKHLKLSDYDYVYAYGDSSGDKELLTLANESYYKPFRDD